MHARVCESDRDTLVLQFMVVGGKRSTSIRLQSDSEQQKSCMFAESIPLIRNQ
jgi:hypothetical protein